jgi:hypothetical protein
MRMKARLATKVAVRATKPRSEAMQAPHFAAARWDDSWRASAWSLGLPRHPGIGGTSLRAAIPQRAVAAQRGLRSVSLVTAANVSHQAQLWLMAGNLRAGLEHFFADTGAAASRLAAGLQAADNARQAHP